MATDQQRIDLQIRLADALAEHALLDKTDKHGKPLIDHSRRVAAAVKHLSHEQHVAALLHDVVEETAGTSTDNELDFIIYRLFGLPVGNLVSLLTRYPTEEYQRYIENLSSFPLARPIKLADLNDNLDATRGPIEPSLKQRYERARQLLIDVEREEKERGQATTQPAQPSQPVKGNQP